MANTKLCPEVTDILSRSTITENLLVLPPGQLDRKLYEKVAKAIQSAGGKWKTNKQGFVFDSDPRAKLGMALETGVVVDEKKERQAFYTPEALADEVARMADVRGRVVLEPSAGGGALVAACLAHGARMVDAVELDRDTAVAFKQKYIPTGKVSCWIGDFLTHEVAYKYPRIVMNPPFAKGQVLKHVAHARKLLARGGRLFAIVPDNKCPKLAALGAETVKVFAAGSFKESGTNIATRLICITA
jgi:hypothetical protein